MQASLERTPDSILTSLTWSNRESPFGRRLGPNDNEGKFSATASFWQSPITVSAAALS